MSSNRNLNRFRGLQRPPRFRRRTIEKRGPKDGARQTQATPLENPDKPGAACIRQLLSLFYTAEPDNRGSDGGGNKLAVEWTVREVLNWTRGYFKNAGISQPRLEAEILLAHTLDVERLQLYLSPDKPLTAQERSGYRTAIQKRHGGMPLQHIIGEVSFFGLTFRVNGDTLVPRPETEELLDHTLKLTPRNQDITCLDLGTGSGAIAVCLARYLPRAIVLAADISEKALALAQENAARNGVRDRVTFVQSNWFENVHGRFDFIASNPPYISEEEWSKLPADVKDHEPRVALDGGIGGIEQLAAIAESVKEHLNPDGRVLFEIGATQGKAVADMLERAGLIEIRIERDLAGKERFAIARCPS